MVNECTEILTDMVKMLKRKAVEIVEDSQEPEVVTELVSLQKEIFSQPTEVVEFPVETLVDLPADLLWS